MVTNKEYMVKIKEAAIDSEKVGSIEKRYQAELPLAVRAIISNAEKPVFLEHYRVLAYVEMLDANEDLDTDFVGEKIIPLMDCGDNDFIVYHFDTKKWSMYNIVDNCTFMQKESLEELLE